MSAPSPCTPTVLREVAVALDWARAQLDDHAMHTDCPDANVVDAADLLEAACVALNTALAARRGDA